MKNKLRPSMAAVSKLSGVTVMTVSRFFSGKTPVSEATQAAIIDACERLGFRFAQCRKIGELPINLVIRGQPNYLCGYECCREFTGRRLKMSRIRRTGGK